MAMSLVVSSYPKGFRKGLALRGMPVLDTYGGNVYWVDSNGGGGGRGTFNHPDLTLNTAYDRCTSDNGDIVMIKPGHSETLTATVALDTNAVAIIGLGHGSKRPQITLNMAAAGDNGFEVSGAGQYIENISIIDGHTTVASIAQVMVDVATGGDTLSVVNCRFEPKSGTGEVFTLQAAADDVSIIGCDFICVSAPANSGPDTCITVEGACDRLTVDSCRFDFTQAAAILPKSAVISFEVSDSYAPLIKDCIITGVGNGKYFVESSIGQSAYGGIIAHCFGSVADLTDVFAVTNGFVVIDSYFTEAGKFAGAGIAGLTSGDIPIIPSGTAVV